MAQPEIVDDHNERVHRYAQPKFTASLTHAWHGVVHILKHERNARIHLGMAVAALWAGVMLQVSSAQLAAVFFAIILVFIAEIFNTAIERTLDLIDLRENAHIKLIKDMAAGAVLVAAVAASVMGAAIFLPKIVRLVWGI